MPPAAEYFVGFVDGTPVAHVAVCPRFNLGYYRATRLVVMPEWQGAGVGTRFLEWVCEYHKTGNGRRGKKFPTLFHTSHPQLIGYLKYSKKWALKSRQLGGSEKSKPSAKCFGRTVNAGGHFRAVQGFKYIGDGRAPR